MAQLSPVGHELTPPISAERLLPAEVLPGSPVIYEKAICWCQFDLAAHRTGQQAEIRVGWRFVCRTHEPLEMVRGLVGHGLGYSLLATKPANNMTYDGRALVARPLTGAAKNNRLVLAALRGRSMSPLALEFAEHCRSLFGVNSPHSEAHARGSPPRYAPGEAQSC